MCQELNFSFHALTSKPLTLKKNYSYMRIFCAETYKNVCVVVL